MEYFSSKNINILKGEKSNYDALMSKKLSNFQNENEISFKGAKEKIELLKKYIKENQDKINYELNETYPVAATIATEFVKNQKELEKLELMVDEFELSTKGLTIALGEIQAQINSLSDNHDLKEGVDYISQEQFNNLPE